MKPTITIEYCPKCHWLLRAAYMAQEILTTFADEVAALVFPTKKYLTEKNMAALPK
jgi:predicted Rdx family selenoprotein